MRSANALRPESADSTLLRNAAGAGSTTATARRNILRPYATAGVAIVGASLIAVTPAAAPPLPGIHTIAEVGLTAGALDDFLAPWTQVFNTASENATQLFNAYSLSGNSAWQQLVANFSGYAQQILDDPANITQVADDIRESWKAVDSAITLMNASPDTVNNIIAQTMDGPLGHSMMFGQIGGYLPPDQVDMITPIINFLGSPWSAIVMGALGPGISPWVALFNSLTDGDSFSQTMVNMSGAFLNGATLNLDSLVPLINDAGFLPPDKGISHIDIAFGGLLSPGGHVHSTPISLVDGDGNVVGEVPAIGGSIFNSLGITLTGIPVLGKLDLVSDPIGPLGAWLGLNQVIASQLGWGTGWDGKSFPHVPAMPPGSDVDFPTVPADFFSDDGGVGGAAATDFSAMLQDLFTGVGG